VFHYIAKYKKNKSGIILIFILFFNLLIYGSTTEAVIPYQDTQKNSVVLEDNKYALVPYSFGFAIITLQGYYNFEGNFLSYKIPLPREFYDIELGALSASQLAGKTYILHPEGGQLYQFEQGAIKRIETSFAQQNYHDTHLFSYGNSLYLLGGYEQWTSKKDLLRYDFSSNQWEKVSVSGEGPYNGVRGISAVQTMDALYVVNSYYTSLFDGKNRINTKIYRLDLTSFRWSHTYDLDEKTAEYIALHRQHGVQIEEEWVVFPSASRQEYLAIDPVNGLMKTRKSEDFYFSNRKPLFLNGQWISLRKKQLNSSHSELIIEYYNNAPYTEIIALDNNVNMAKALIIGIIGFLIFLIFLWRILYGNKTFFLKKMMVVRGLYFIPLNKAEMFFLKKLAKYGYANNSELVDFFKEEGKTQDLFIKRKNNMVKELDAKLRLRFKCTFFTKKTDPNDLRQSIYTIAPKIILRLNH